MNYTVQKIAEVIHAKLLGNNELFVMNNFFDSRNINTAENGAFWCFSGKTNGFC